MRQAPIIGAPSKRATRMSKAFTNEETEVDDDDGPGGGLAAACGQPQLHDARRVRAPRRRARRSRHERAARRSSRRSRGRPATAIAPRTATTSTARSACARSTGASASWSGGSTSPKSSTRRRAATTTRRPGVLRRDRASCATHAGATRTISIVGVDEIDTARGYISWVSPMARALLKAREGDVVTCGRPGGAEELEIVDVRYDGARDRRGGRPR